MGVKDVKELEKAYEEYKRITSDKALMNAIINMDMAEMDRAQEITDARQEGREEGRQEGRQEGREEGRQEGIKEGEVRGEDRKKIEIAKKMLEAKVDIEKISEFTGLTIEEVEKLKEDND